jgi:predicted nucleic acid-binding protein
MTTFVDTNVLISLLSPNEPYHQWSTTQLQLRKAQGPALICDIVYCEFSVGMPDVAMVDAAISRLALDRFGRSSDAILVRAGQAFKQYKEKHNGPKMNVLPDFLIGAAAEVSGAPLLTANKRDYTGYFPNLQLISP